MKNCTYYFFDDMTNIKNFDRNKIMIDGKSYLNILIYDVGYVTRNSVKTLFLIIHKIKRYIERCYENKHLTLGPADKSNDTLKNMRNYGIK